MSYAEQLEAAVKAARIAGDLISQDFHRPGGPRGSGSKAPVDTEAEAAIRETLDAAFPDYGVIAEELPHKNRPPADAEAHVWLIDPNDGTSPYLKGCRGSAVSIGLLRDGVPVLGVVFAPLAPDDNGDFFAWAEGCGPLTRNGVAITPAQPTVLSSYSVVIVSQDADRKSAANAASLHPARFLPMPSVAYRLALVAAGEADAATSLNGPGALDVAAGHALLRGAGMDLCATDGKPVTYGRSGHLTHGGDCIAGSAAVVANLASRNLRSVLRGGPDAEPEWPLVRPTKGASIADADVLSRAQGCLLGQCAGDALGQLVEFKSAAAIARQYPGGVRELKDGGTWNTLAGQPTDDSELALLLARSIVMAQGYDQEAAAKAYAWWMDSKPFDVGNTTRTALGPARAAAKAGQSAAVAALKHASTDSQANGALMRVSPLGILAWNAKPEQAATWAREDAALTHPNPVCRDANAVFVVAIAYAIRTGASAREVVDFANGWASANGLHTDVLATLEAARDSAPTCEGSKQGWVRVALQNAFYELLHAESLEEGVVRTVMRGGDTDTNAAITGALLGAVRRRQDVPAQWRHMVLSCRPLPGDSRGYPVRPKPVWPVDAMQLAERLLLLGTSPKRA